MIEENNIIYCRKCNAKVPDGKKCNECGCYVDSVDLSITSEHRCPKCSAMMKESICRNCGYNYFTALEEEQERRSAFIRSFVPDTTKRKIAVIVVCILTLVLGVVIGTMKANYSNSVEVDRLRKSLNHEKDNTTRVQAQFDQYKATMQPYEAQQEANAKAAAEQKAAEEKAKKEAEEKAAAEKAAQEAEAKKQAEEQAKKDAEAKATAEQAKKETEAKQSTSTSNTGIMTKSYKPTGKEPNWIEIISYCDAQMPKVIGYDASISLDENDTKIIKTGLRYKIETDKLKIESNKSYHKAIFIIEFENDNYENFRVSTAEVDGVKIR